MIKQTTDTGNRVSIVQCTETTTKALTLEDIVGNRSVILKKAVPFEMRIGYWYFVQVNKAKRVLKGDIWKAVGEK